MKKSTKIVLSICTVLLIAGLCFGWTIYKKIYSPNIYVKDCKYLYIRDNANSNEVLDSIYANFCVENPQMLELVMTLKHYNGKVKPGRYRIEDGMSNNALVNMLRAGNQDPVNLSFNNIRSVKQLCAKVAKQIDIDSSYLLDIISDEAITSKYGFTPQNIIAMFIPDTYQFYWNTSAEKFLDKMYFYYKQFWTEDRLAKARKINLTPLEVSTLASIVQSEQAAHREEQPTIAGLYLNRLRIGMPLQSCPTLIYAIGDFTIKRVTGAMLDIESPYNTYKNTGLPPSPIGFPEKGAIDAVLNYESNEYLYMCAKSDFSGYHHFSRSYEEQKHWAREFQRQLDKQGVK